MSLEKECGEELSKIDKLIGDKFITERFGCYLILCSFINLYAKRIDICLSDNDVPSSPFLIDINLDYMRDVLWQIVPKYMEHQIPRYYDTLINLLIDRYNEKANLCGKPHENVGKVV